MTQTRRIAFIGGGNMAQALIGGLSDGEFGIAVADPDPGQRERLARLPHVSVCESNAEAASGAEAVVLAVKPQVATQALATAAAVLRRERPLVLSIAAGLRTATIEAAVGDKLALVRAMPNTPALVGRGITAFFPNPRVDDAGRLLAREILAAAGKTIEVADEALLDPVTAVSGSGPAYFFLLVEALGEAGIAAGLPPETARELASATGIGAMALLDAGDAPPSELRRRVTSPGGTTAAALDVFAEGDLRGLVRQAVLAATERARELSKG